MDYSMACEICCSEFNDDLIIPKMLSCGHSFCLSCIRKLIKSRPFCPKCRKELDKSKIAVDYPTVYLILDAVKLVKNVECLVSSEKLLMKRTESIKENLTNWKSQISDDLDQINDDLEQLQILTDKENELVNLKKVNRFLDSLENEYRNKNDFLSATKRLKGSVTISLSDFEDHTKYLMEIYNRLRNEEKIYTVKNIDECAKFGKVSFRDNMILFHALEDSETPDNSALIWFDELKQCVDHKNFFTFLKLSCNSKNVIQMSIIKMQDSQLASQFIKLCTGECGPTYKKCYYENFKEKSDLYRPVLELKNYMSKDSLMNGPIDYISTETNGAAVDQNDIYIIGEASGRFRAYKALKNCSIWHSPIGIVESPKDLDRFISFNNSSKLKIIDCGIIFKMF